ncbi:MAG: diguanylate cyclase [Maritimibacter sp.]|nr:diguanylate cyclase [Maritimibacter sp.]
MAGRILIADSTAASRIILRVKLAAARYDIVQAASTDEVMTRATLDHPDLIIVDAHLPGSSGGARALVRRLKANPAFGAIPIIVTDPVPGREARLAALTAGADDYLAKPFDELTLLALVRHLLRARVTHDELTRRQDTAQEMGLGEAVPDVARSGQVAVIAANAPASAEWQRALADRIDAEVTILDRNGVLDHWAVGEAPDAFVIGADLSHARDGLMLVSELRSRPATRHAVIVIQDAAGDPGSVAMALDIGANAVLSGGFDAEEAAVRLKPLLARKFEVDALRRAAEARLSLAVLDPLTGLYNRRYAETYMRRVIAQAEDTGLPFALMLLDLDRFKSVNDTHGHSVGDEVLVEVAKRLRENLREVDLLVRHGGEEFLVALPATDFDAASAAAERLRRVIAEAPVVATTGEIVPVTLSIGVTVCTGAADAPQTLQELIVAADRALYASKSDGRNQVSFAATAAA